MRWIVRGLSAVLMLVLVLVGLVFLIPADRVAQIAARQAEAATGRALTIEGPVRPSVWPGLGVSTGPVRLANAPWSQAGPMLTAGGLELRLDTAALIAGRIAVTSVRLDAPQIVLERGPGGQTNWDLETAGVSGPGGETGGSPDGLTLDLAQIIGGRVRYIDRAAGVDVDLSDIDAEIRMPEAQGRLTFATTARHQGRDLSFSASAGSLAQLLAGAIGPVEAALALGRDGAAGRVSFAGQAGLAPLQAEGRIAARLADPGAWAALAGLDDPGLPPGLGARSIALEGQAVLAAAGTMHLREGRLDLDHNRLTLGADLRSDGVRPHLRAQISAGTLDLSALAPSDAPASPAAAQPQGWSRAPLNLGALGALDADLTLAAEALSLGPARLGRLRAGVTLDAARAVISLTEAAVYDGRASGQVVLNGRGNGSASADLALTGVAAQPLLRDLAGYDRLSTAADLRIRLLASGASQQAMMTSLSGEGSLSFGPGALQGLDLAGMLRRLDPSFVGEGQRTIFEVITASFTIRDGVLRNDDLLLAAPLLRAAGAGTVGIGAQDIDYRITPTALQRDDGTGGLRVPLLVTGPWAAPRFRIDARAIADERLQAERARAEQRAREEVERRAQERLNPEDGESLEDAAKRRLERELRRGLGRLLGD